MMERYLRGTLQSHEVTKPLNRNQITKHWYVVIPQTQKSELTSRIAFDELIKRCWGYDHVIFCLTRSLILIAHHIKNDD